MSLWLGTTCERFSSLARSTYGLGEQPSGSYNVMLSGAHGDGVSDDRQHILDAIAAAGSAAVYFPAGTYLLSSTLTVPDGTDLVGESGTGPDATTAWLRGKVYFGSGSTFSDLKIGPDALADGLCALRNIDGANGTSFTRCHFRGGGGLSNDAQTVALGAGADLYNTTFTDCEFERSLGTYWYGSGTPSGHSENTLSITANGNVVDSMSFYGCHFGVSNGVATGAQRIMVEIWTAHGTSNLWRDMIFDGCTFEAANCHQLDFACYTDSGWAENVTVTNNVFKGGGVNTFGTLWGYGLCLEWPNAPITITGNTFYRCSYSAIWPGFDFMRPNSSAWQITGNTFDFDTAYDGIPTSGIRNVVKLSGVANVFTNNTIIYHDETLSWPNAFIEAGPGDHLHCGDNDFYIDHIGADLVATAGTMTNLEESTPAANRVHLP